MKKENITVREMMGEEVPMKMDLSPIKEALGEDLPEIPANSLGKIRLVKLLRNKYGINYRNFAPAIRALNHFESEMRYIHHYMKVRSGRHGR